MKQYTCAPLPAGPEGFSAALAAGRALTIAVVRARAGKTLSSVERSMNRDG
jgi:hypothetical protein